MKKFYLLSVLFFGLFNGFSQTPITLTFHAKDSLTQNPLALDSVNIKNLTENCDTTLYDSVSVLNIVALWPVGIEDPASKSSESFTVMQNVPNPFRGSTLVRIYLKNAGELNLAVYDNQGKQLSEYHNGFEKGWQLFGVTTGGTRMLLLKVSDNSHSKTIKLISAGSGDEENRISYKGQDDQGSETLKSVSDETGFIVYLGNQLQYTAYVNGYHEKILLDNPVSSETYTFEMRPTGFNCGDVVNYSGQNYNTVLIGTQCWFRENLNVGTRINGVVHQTNNSVIEKYCYNNLPSNCNVYGGLYQWGEMMQYVTTEGARGICPEGWHVPAASEWIVLREFLGDSLVAGGKMKETGYTHWAPPNTGATNSSGFTGLGAGVWTGMAQVFADLTTATGFWSSSAHLTLALHNNSGDLVSAYLGDDQWFAVSLRCLRDQAIPTVTTAGITGITQTTATNGGNVTSDGGAPVTARGVCWSKFPNPTTSDSLTTDGTGTGTFVSNLTGLTPNTPYYVRAYATNSVGTAYGNEETFTTLPAAFTCGSSITINHVAGAVAPVDKTVTYGTVTNIPGETSKCWITSNLGADHQATAVSDATEPSAGWYWQFNRKQGYKHTGTVRTPNTLWITSISENSTWIPANDPCALELGSGWRIPTKTEWTNVDASGNWTDWNGPWNSALKMHAAGDLLELNGSLDSRGSFGYYWSSTQIDANSGWQLYFYGGGSGMSNPPKELGCTLRCIKEPGASTIPTVSTSPVIDITPTTVTSGGNVTADGGAPVIARGVCWSTTPTPTTAGSHTTDGSGTGTFVSNLTGLTPNTPYYVRAYATNSVGTAYGNEENFTTLPAAFTCGSSITINHVAGAVAPVDKTVTYGTVTNIPGETSKCWITSNLGADHQATAKDDATEASAGWYWQFNRKQGYKVTDEGTRTPNTTWISSISENSDWIPVNDPCALELGSGWRIPSKTEWTNVDASGNWTNWNGPWNSGLKMHAAGDLNWSDGSLHDRGSYGYYRCLTQGGATYDWGLEFNSGDSSMGYTDKANGFSARCVKD